MFNTEGKKYIYSATLIFLLIFIEYQTFAQANNKKWVLDKNKNGVKIYLRKHIETGLKEVKGVMEMHTNLSAIITLLKDLDNQRNWMYANKSTIMLSSENAFHWILHTFSSAPFPFSDRDLISEANMQQDSNLTVIIKIHAKPDYVPIDSKHVRIKYMQSEWKFIPKNNGIVEIQFKILINLGGNLPIWAMNFAVDKGPYNTLVAMRKQLQMPKYKNAKILPYLKF